MSEWPERVAVYRDKTQTNDWDGVPNQQRLRYAANLAELLAAVQAIGNELALMVVDADIEPHLFSEIVRSMRKTSAEAILLRERKAWISAPAGDGKRRFYALEERDIPTYLAGHGLLSAGQPCPKLMPAEVPLARVLPPHDGVPPVGHLVLIAEDERKSREHACEVLRGLGYSVVLAGTGLQAVRLSQSLKPATILLDGLMPEMHGFEVARLIRHLDRSYTPRILAVTAIYKAMRYQNEAKLKYGIDGYLIKPLTTDAIAAALEQARAA